MDTILKLSDAFQASILSTVLRFTEIGKHETTAVIYENNVVKWYAQSKDFPKWTFRFKLGNSLPPSTVAGEFYTKKDAKYTGVENVDPNDWFIQGGHLKHKCMNNVNTRRAMAMLSV